MESNCDLLHVLSFKHIEEGMKALQNICSEDSDSIVSKTNGDTFSIRQR
jgi:hypothetical protein